MASPDIYTEIERLNAIDSNYDRRRAIESMPSDERFTVQIVIDKIERFYGYIREDGFRDGRSVVGTMANGEQELKLVFPANMNDEIDDWNEHIDLDRRSKAARETLEQVETLTLIG